MRKSNRLLKKWKSRRGYSLMETMTAVLILLLVTGGLATGMRLASRQYQRSLLSSQCRVLSSTLKSVLEDELANTDRVELRSGRVYFSSKSYAPAGELCALAPVDDQGHEATYGELALGTGSGTGFSGKKLVSSACYTGGMKVGGEITYNSLDGIFTVTLTVVDGDGNELLADTLDVRPLNSLVFTS